ncbi:MAG: hypothetical protein ACYC1T_03890 [Sulfuricaulis sp.]
MTQTSLISLTTFFGLMVGMTADISFAGYYELAKYIPTGVRTDKSPVYPKNMELCKAYEANLNSFSEVKEPFACERPINQKFADFSKPKWKEIDPKHHLELLLEIERIKYRSYTRPYPFDGVGYRKGIQENVRLGLIRLKLAELDIVPSPESATHMPDGIPEKVLRIERGDPKCDPSDDKWRRSPPVREYFIVNDDLTKVEEFRAAAKTWDVFLYKGKVYFDAFYNTYGVDSVSGIDGPGRNHRYEVYVTEPYRKGTARICRYLYFGENELKE